MLRLNLVTFILIFCTILTAQDIHFRINQVGYLPQDSKIAYIMATQPILQEVSVHDAGSQEKIFKGVPYEPKGEVWGDFPHHYLFDFSEINTFGNYYIKIGEHKSPDFTIDKNVFATYHEDLIEFMQQQRCGYNPYYDEVCHQGDGRIFDAPVPDSTFFDFTGGWHDAGDQLKYLITSSNATARMLLAYELAPDIFGDRSNHYGQPHQNELPDVLDEARWGLEWILKLHPQDGWLIHQIADDRDHRGFKYPHQDNAEYGWGPNSYRTAYFATGTPQGLGKWKSEATGIANLAGRSAAALAIGARVWRNLGIDSSFSMRCEEAARSLYKMGKQQEGFQQGNSYGAPYRYNENTWADDMQWGGAELFKLTRDSAYLEDAIRYANITKDEGWMAQDTMVHYEKYPFMNLGHFSLFQIAPESVQNQLIGWYKSNIEKVLLRSTTNAFQIGVPFLWCSNNLMVNLITQVILYEKMSGDKQYHNWMLLHRDWLLGRNPWGTSMFTGIPREGETPIDVHIPPRALLGETPPGGLVDGPIYRTIHDYLLGLTLNEPDEFSPFQNDFVVYHDDIGDYSTNEPTMDGTADAILMMALWHMD